ncbi:MAG: hypothetical protein NVSMB21_15470 [Vulcanimicrobiaceae bacterium]
MRLYVVGTDTGVGKTRVTAALAYTHARAIANARAYIAARGESVATAVRPPLVPHASTIVKLVQTGLLPGVPGDAEDAARLVRAALRSAPVAASEPASVGATEPVAWRELARFREPADPWNAALAEETEPLAADALAAELDTIAGDLIVEGSGGAAVPLDARHTISDVARAAGCEAVLVVGLRLGCINHAYLTLAYLERLGMPVRGAIATEPFGPVGDAYRHQVERALVAKVRRIRHLAWDDDAVRSVAGSAAYLTPFLEDR